jgi:hypothetical protein
LGHAVALLRLHVHQVHARQSSARSGVELVQQIRLQRADREDQKDAEADGHHDDARLVARPV